MSQNGVNPDDLLLAYQQLAASMMARMLADLAYAQTAINQLERELAALKEERAGSGA
jgi:hypothetical protein